MFADCGTLQSARIPRKILELIGVFLLEGVSKTARRIFAIGVSTLKSSSGRTEESSSTIFETRSREEELTLALVVQPNKLLKLEHAHY